MVVGHSGIQAEDARCPSPRGGDAAPDPPLLPAAVGPLGRARPDPGAAGVEPGARRGRGGDSASRPPAARCSVGSGAEVWAVTARSAAWPRSHGGSRVGSSAGATRDHPAMLRPPPPPLSL